MRWFFGTVAVLCAAILFLPFGGTSTWSAAGNCSSALGVLAQQYSARASSNCSVDQVGTFVLGLLIVGCIGLAVLFQMRHRKHRAHNAAQGRLAEHLEDCELCEKDLPCAEWERLYEIREARA